MRAMTTIDQTQRAAVMTWPSSQPAPAAAAAERRRAVREQPAPLEAVWARSEADVRAVQRLRYRVFVEEMGATPPQRPHLPGHDCDAFDAYCEHLMVRTVATDREPARLLGTYRLLTPAAARLAGGYYSETEFDLRPLDGLRAGMVELGRSCVDPQWRNGSVILTLWASLAEFMHRNGVQSVIGCASVPLLDGGLNAAALWRQLRLTHLAPAALQVRPRLPLPVQCLPGVENVETPPLIKGYLRCGARVLGAPAWDPDFRCADLPLLLRWDDLSPSYRKHFVGA